MTNMKLFLELIARSTGLRSELDGSGRAVTRFTKGAKREVGELKSAFGSLQSKLAAVGLSIGAVAIAMDSARLDKGLTQIGQTAGASKAEVSALRQDLFRMGRESGQSIDELKNGFDALVQSGLNMKEAKSTLDGVNVAMAVTGANAQALSGGLTVAATAFQFDLSKPGQALELLDKMTVAGRLGNAELQNLADIFARVGVNAKSAGMSFDKSLAFIEGLSKVERNPERLATLADSTLRIFNNLRYQEGAQKSTGVSFFDAKGGRRDALDVVDDLRKKYGQLKTDKERAMFIQAAFGKADLDTIKGIKTLMTGDILPQVRKFSETIGSAGGTLKRDFSDATRNLVDQVGMVKNDLRQAADGFVKPINEALGHFIQFARAPKKDGGLSLDGKEMVGVGVAAGLSGMLLKRYGPKVGGALLKRFTGYGSVAAGVAEGKALQAATGVTPVFVTNWPGGGTPGAPGNGDYSVFKTPGYGTAPKTPGPVKLPGRLGGMGRLADMGRVGATLAGSVGAAGAGTVAASALAAGAAGYGIGTLIERKFIKGAIGEAIYDLLHPSDKQKPEQKNDIKIDISIDGQGPVMTRTNGMNNKVTTMKRGSFFDAITALPPGY